MCIKGDPTIKEVVDRFAKQKRRVTQGNKEAKWNNKYMKIIEKPVRDIENTKDLKTIQITIKALLNSLKNIYESSNFYKEARIVSFVDRLLKFITEFIKERVGLGKSIQSGINNYQYYSNITIAQSKAIIQKFHEEYFVINLMKEQSTLSQIKDAQGNALEEEEKTSSHNGSSADSNEYKKMSGSFYSKENLDFLYFSRPGTAYGSGSFMN